MAKPRSGPTVIKPDGRKRVGKPAKHKKLAAGEGRGLVSRKRDEEGRAVAGRPIAYTIQVHRSLCDAVRSGLSHEAAEAAAGLSDGTLAHWRKKAPESKALASLFLDLAQAEAEFEGVYINPLVKASQKGNLKAATALAGIHMKRRSQQVTARLKAEMQKVEIQVNDRSISVQVAQLSLEQLDELAGLNGDIIDTDYSEE